MANRAAAKKAAKAAPAKVRKPVRARKKRNQQKPLPEPESVPVQRPEPAKEPSLIDQFLGSSPNPEQAGDFSNSSEMYSTSASEPLSDEARRLIDSIPEHIGESGATAADTDNLSESEIQEITALVDVIEFEPEEVAAAVAQFCEFLDKMFGDEVWALNEMQKGLVGKPYAKLANSLWVHVKRMLPGWLAAACDATPGLAASLLVTSVVFGPKAFRQWALIRTRKRTPRIIQANNAEREPEPQPQTAPQTAAPATFNENERTKLRSPAGQGA